MSQFTEIAERAQRMLDAAERVVIPMEEAPLLAPGNCSCGRPGAYAVSLRMDGEEVAWLNVCEGHRDTKVKLTVEMSWPRKD